MDNWFSSFLFILATWSLLKDFKMCVAADPTDGFISVPLSDDNFQIQKPYNVPLDQRFSYEDGVRRMWVYSNDKPFKLGSHTQPRTEIRITGLDYSSGVWQFEGYSFVPKGTSGATILQIHGAANAATTIILRIYDGDMRYYSTDIIATDLYDKWFKVNLVHDVDEGTVTVFIDDVEKYQNKDHGPGEFYFKCGVYGAPKDMSHYMESRWKDIKIYHKLD